MEVIVKPTEVTSCISSSEDKTERKEKPVTLQQCIKRIMSEMGDEFRKQHLTDFHKARRIATYVIRWTFNKDCWYQNHIRTRQGRVKLIDFRTVDENTFRCNVPLKPPSPADSFTFRYKRPQEIPPHRMLITLNEDLDKVNRLNQRRHWKECIDEDEVFRPDYILKLFNRGLTNTCETLRQESWRKKLGEEFGCDLEIATKTKSDSTICIHIHIKAGDENDRKPLDINIVPTLSITKLPRQIRIRTPFPNRQKYFEQKDKFEKDVVRGIKKGEILCLEACVWTQSHTSRLDKNISYTWNVSCSSLEDKGLQCISEVISPEALENIILLIRKIRKEHLMGLNPLTNQMVQNAVFHVHRKNIGTFMSDDQWFLEVMATIAAQLRDNCAPSFFLNSRNLLDGWEMRFVQWMGNELQRVHSRIKERPQLLDYYVGAKSMFDEDDVADNEQNDGNSFDANEKVDPEVKQGTPDNKYTSSDETD